MVSEKDTHLHASRDSTDFDGKKLELNSNVENKANESQTACDRVDDGIFTIDDLGQRNEEQQSVGTMVVECNKDVKAQPPTQSIELVESLSVSHFTKTNIVQTDKSSEPSNLADQKDQKHDLGVDVMNGKTPEGACTSKESSVRVLYSSLPSGSKKKLEELLHNWSEWHAKHYGSIEDPVDPLESGEETYFPALHVGSDKLSTVSFSMDVHVRKRQRKDLLQMDNGCSPMYDRGYAIGLASDEGVSEGSDRDLREAPRCFNCGSYNHPLSDCPKPRDIAAVNSARKQFLSKKSHSAGPRVPTRYYQESPGGKFDGLKPGALSAETRTLLGLGELDPPPWLYRMRELGYPPAYLDREEEDQPSGITIFGDEEPHDTALKNGLPSKKSSKKMNVDFPGINAPIPENADQWRWAAPAPTPSGPPHSDISWNQSHNRQNYPQQSFNNGHFHRDYRQRNYAQTPSYHFGPGSSPPLSHFRHDYPPSESVSPRGIPIPANAAYGRSPDSGRPFLNYNYGSL